MVKQVRIAFTIYRRLYFEMERIQDKLKHSNVKRQMNRI